jgi:hypothetical protein
MDDDVVDDVEKISLIADVSYVDWMMRGIDCMSKEFNLSTYSGSSLYR